jgi:ketosteroid isomerase-like protein
MSTRTGRRKACASKADQITAPLAFALAAIALAQPVAAQTPAEAERAIRDQRAAFNRAIAATDLPAIAAVLADHVQMITGSDSIHVAGKQAHLDRWAEGFKDPNRLVYVRIPTKVTVSPLLPIALETGHWRGATAGATKDWIGGDYTAKWRRIDGVWRVEVETYVTMRCRGLCP